MASFNLDADYTATYVPYRHGPGYVAKGTVFFRERPVRIFDAYGDTITKAEQVAWATAQEIYDQMRTAKRKKHKKSGRPKKRH